MIKYLGSSGSLSLLSDGEHGAIVDNNLGLVVKTGYVTDLAFAENWDLEASKPTPEIEYLAYSVIQALSYDEALTAAADRMYTIPGNVQAEAKKALKWHAEEHRGGTPVGLNTARTLAKGGQIGIHKIRHIAKYFPRHEVDKKGKGWEPGEDNFPSNGRIAWALWGGDGAQRWASTIVERENKKALVSGGYSISYDDVDFLPDVEDITDINSTSAFTEAHALDPNYGPEFLARVRLDGSGIDRLYKVEIDGRVYLWDGNTWDNMGLVDGDVYTYDESLDDQYDQVDKDHIIIDPSSAIIISALFKQTPYGRVSIDDIDSLEARLAADALPEIDLEMLDRVITAAGAATTETISGKTDGNYTPQERAANATNQLRDATGRFAATGSRVVVGGDRANGSGVVTKTDSTTGNVTVKLDNGKTIDVGAKYTQAEETAKAAHQIPDSSGRPLDTSGILGKPRMVEGSKGARIPGTLPPMSAKDVKDVITNWPKYVANTRAGFTPMTAKSVGDYAKKNGITIVAPRGNAPQPSIADFNK